MKGVKHCAWPNQACIKLSIALTFLIWGTETEFPCLLLASVASTILDCRFSSINVSRFVLLPSGEREEKKILVRLFHDDKKF